MNQFNKLAPHKFKLAGLLISIAAIGLLIILQILNFDYQETWEQRIFIINHYIIVFGLFMIMYSREIRDDERVQKIRYTLLKLAFAICIGALMIYISISSLNRVEFSVFVILYIIEAILILYNISFRICLLINPEWIFNEKVKSNRSFYVLLACLLFLLAWIIYVVIEYKI